MVPLADRIELLTPSWLTGALTDAGVLADGAQVSGLRTELVGTGQMGSSVRLQLTYDGGAGPTTLVAKLPATDPTSRETGLATRAYEKEIRFYQQLASTVQVRAPACHHADIDVETGSFVLVLEDLAPARQGDQLAGCDPDVAEVVVRQAARLHAPRLGDRALAELDWLASSTPERRRDLAAALPVLWAGFCERYDGRLDADTIALGERFVPDVARYYASARGAETIVHGDYRLDNLLFGDPSGDTPVAVVDWQTTSLGVPVADVAYFLGAGLTTDERRAVERDLLDAYLGEMAALGAPLDPDESLLGYRAHGLSGLHMAIVASMIVERTDRGDEMFLAMADRHAVQALDHDALAAVAELTA